MTINFSSLFVFGLGYCCLRLVERHGEAFSHIAGTVRLPGKAEELRRKGITAVLFSSDEAMKLAVEADAVIVSIPPDEEGDPALRRFADVLAEAGRCRWLGYLSTTGVYGDRGGALTSEAAPVRPSNRRSQWRADAECAWLAWGAKAGIAVHIFRLAGIYGPGRSAFDALRNGTARRIVKEGQIFNRIHVDDVATVLLASMERPRAGAVYNVSDDKPAPPQDVIRHAARLIGMEPPPEIPFDEAELSPAARSFYSENKYIGNRLLEDELHLYLAYPTYLEGLGAILAEE